MPALVSTEWVAAHLNDPGVAVVHVAMAHHGAPSRLLPGARFVDYHALETSEELSIELPPVAERLPEQPLVAIVMAMEAEAAPLRSALGAAPLASPTWATALPTTAARAASRCGCEASATRSHASACATRS